ncbi:MAG TPA: YeiH family putative sulfate export transporter [Oceanospirillales bacterium]|nr:YeiH family putative sulfate export transporter [Oceanospirillales bacterium]
MNASANNKIYGILLVAIFAVIAIFIAQIPHIKAVAISPLVIGIVLGMFFANTIRHKISPTCNAGILFSSKTLLRIAIVFYGFRITFQQIQHVGIEGLAISTIMLTSTMLLGVFIGTKLLKLDRDTSILVASGSAVCGAAAVLATEDVLKSKPHKTAMAVGTVVLFGTLSMFLYPILFESGILNMNLSQYGLYVGSSVHEVAQVVAAGGAVDPVSSDTAIIVKMIRVMMIAPMLLILGIFLSKIKTPNTHGKSKLVIPWFAVLFIAVAGFHSLHLLPANVVAQINHVDTFLLTMAMTALGMETHINKFKQAGLRPVLLAFVLFVWLLTVGYLTTMWVSSLSLTNSI